MTDSSWILFEKHVGRIRKPSGFTFWRLARTEGLHDVFPTYNDTSVVVRITRACLPACPAYNRHDDAISKTLVVT